MRGVFAGALALIALHAAVSSREASERVGGIFEHLASFVRRAIDPSVAAIPERSGGEGAPPKRGGRPQGQADDGKQQDNGNDDDDDGWSWPRLPKLPNPL